jgi:hypothetical protein
MRSIHSPVPGWYGLSWTTCKPGKTSFDVKILLRRLHSAMSGLVDRMSTEARRNREIWNGSCHAWSESNPIVKCRCTLNLTWFSNEIAIIFGLFSKTAEWEQGSRSSSIQARGRESRGRLRDLSIEEFQTVNESIISLIIFTALHLIRPRPKVCSSRSLPNRFKYPGPAEF